jgi:acetylxylan esterase
MSMRSAFPILLLVGAELTVASPVRAGTWAALDYGGSNTMSVFKPTSPAASPAIIVALHFCGGSMANAQGWFQSLADKYGFLVIAGKSTGGCWDAAVGRSGERAVIIQAVNYVIENYDADRTRVFTAGASSGACMSQSLLASYPEVFAGGASLAGVPAGAWTGGGEYGWSAPASTTAQQWGDKVRQANPDFTGPRPRLQLWQGMGDTILTYASAYPAQVEQWSNVFGVTDANAMKTSVKPPGAQDTWDRTTYEDESGKVVLEANSGASNVPHDLTPRGLWTDVVRFFGLDGTGGGGGSGAGGTGGAGSGGGSGMGGGGGAAAGAMPSGGDDAGGGTPGSGGAVGSSGTVGSGGDPVFGSGGGPSNGGSAGPSSVAGGTVTSSDRGSCALGGGGSAANGMGAGLLIAALTLLLRRAR